MYLITVKVTDVAVGTPFVALAFSTLLDIVPLHPGFSICSGQRLQAGIYTRSVHLARESM